MRINKTILGLLFLSIFTCITQAQTIHGDLYKWHKVIIDFEGPETSEQSKPNPFTDYRLDVTFTGPNDQEYKVAGFYAADGNAAETSSDSGNVWRVLFTPDQAGVWSYSASFVTGINIATEFEGGESAAFFDGASGIFNIEELPSLSEKDFRAKGKLEYIEEHFLQFRESEEFFLKAGANSPEVFLEYQEFDNTPSSRTYPDHIQDYTEADSSFTWQNGKGKGILGVVNYLSDIGINAFYFLTMNAYGDGKNAWPWINKDSLFVYDVSKLAQWELLFEHMTEKGVMPHLVLNETENEALFELKEDGVAGGFATSRKIYFREMIARFGHHPAITWNIGEENGWEDPSSSIYKKGNTDEQRIQFAKYLRALIYYNDHITIHNGPSTDDGIFNGLLGVEEHTGPAFQWNFGADIYSKILEWRTASIDAGHKWVMNMDEAWLGSETGALSTWRKDVVWSTFMAGGAGVELYIGAGKDISIQDMRRYERFYSPMVTAIDFLNEYVPVYKMEPVTGVSEKNHRTLAQQDSVYLVYLRNGGTDVLNLPTGFYDIHWIDISAGTELETNEIPQVVGSDTTNIGSPPGFSSNDWLVLVTRKDSLSTSSEFHPEEYPQGFKLQQNYPNPFNPSTKINYSVEENTFVTLKVFDSTGREVSTLVNEYKSPASYEVIFDASTLSSGIYYYTLKADESRALTRKMVLVK